MRYPTHIYAKALAHVAMDPKAKGYADIAKNLLALLRKNGEEARARKILNEAGRLARRKSGIRKVTVESARRLGPSHEKMVGTLTKPGDVVQKDISPELVAGIRVIIDDELQFDGSLKGKLDRVFKDI
jgi:F0F1-type ATP synthase delta subunit